MFSAVPSPAAVAPFVAVVVPFAVAIVPRPFGKAHRYAAIRLAPPYPNSGQQPLLQQMERRLDSHYAVCAPAVVRLPMTEDCRSILHPLPDNEDAENVFQERILGRLAGSLKMYQEIVVEKTDYTIVIVLFVLPVARSPGLCKLCGIEIVARAPGVFTRRNSKGALAPITSCNCSG